MQASQRVHPATALAIMVICPLLSAVTLAGIALGFAAMFGAPNDLVIGAVVAAIVFSVNSIALCLALARSEDETRVVAAPTAERVADTTVYARAS